MSTHTYSLVVDYDYFERPEPMVFDEQGTYVETAAQFESTLTARVESRTRRHRDGDPRCGDGDPGSG